MCKYYQSFCNFGLLLPVLLGSNGYETLLLGCSLSTLRRCCSRFCIAICHESMTWSGESLGLDGPWQAVQINIRTPSLRGFRNLSKYDLSNAARYEVEKNEGQCLFSGLDKVCFTIVTSTTDYGHYQDSLHFPAPGHDIVLLHPGQAASCRVGYCWIRSCYEKAAFPKVDIQSVPSYFLLPHLNDHIITRDPSLLLCLESYFDYDVNSSLNICYYTYH